MSCLARLARRFRSIGVALLTLAVTHALALPVAAQLNDACNKPGCQKRRNNQIDPAKRSKSAGDPVILFTGDFDLDETDLDIPGRGMNLTFTRSYRSGTAVSSALGQKWDFAWNQHIVLELRDAPEPAYTGPKKAAALSSGTSVSASRIAAAFYYNGDSRIDEFAYRPGGGGQLWGSPDGYFSKLRHEPLTDLTEQSPHSFVLRSADGTTFTFGARDLGFNPYVQGAVYRITEIRDRRDNVIEFEYARYIGVGPYDFNRLVKVRDTLGREVDIEYQTAPLDPLLIKSITDFDGRKVSFTYDSEDNLLTVTGPAITGTPTDNDFPTGRTTTYDYGPTPSKHLLHKVFDPLQSGSGGIPYLQNTYDVFGKVTRQVLGGEDSSDVMAGGTHAFFYKSYLGAGIPTPLTVGQYFRTRETLHVDPSGIVTLVRYDAHGSERQTFQITGRFDTDTLSPTTGFDDVLNNLPKHGVHDTDPPGFETQKDYNKDGLVTEVRAPGITTRTTYYTGPDCFQRGNAIKTEQLPVTDDLPPPPSIVTVTAYEPIYNQVRATIDPRGYDTNYEPQNGGDHSADRYKTETIFDYQESAYANSRASDLAANWRIDTTQASQFAAFAIATLDTIPNSCGLGEQNGDGTTSQNAGNAIVTRFPIVHLYSDVADPRAGFDDEQTIVTKTWFNAFSRPIATIDAEEAVTSYEYYATAGSGAVASTNGGFLARTLYPESVEMRLEYDNLGRVVKELGPRKNGSQWFTNETVYNAVGEIVQTKNALGHIEEAIYDACGRVTSTRRLTKVPVFVNDIPTGAEEAGPVIVDNFKYDLLNNLIEEDLQADGSTRLRTRHRYDRSGNRVLTLLPESLNESYPEHENNVISTIYDERGLVWKSTRGGVDAAFLTLSANADIADAPASASSAASTTTTNYNLAGNPSVVVDGEGNASLHFYDAFERLIRTEDPLGNTVELTLDVVGQTIESKARQWQHGDDGDVISHTKQRFDELGRSFQTDTALFAIGASVSTPDGPLSPSDGFVTTRVQFDRKGRAVQAVDDNLLSVHTTFDDLDRVTRTDDDLGNHVLTTYDKAGNIIRSESVEFDSTGTTSESFVTHSFYDPLNRLVAVVDNAGQTARFAYDSRDNKVFQSDAKSTSVSTALSSLDTFSEHASLPSLNVNSHGNTVRHAYDDASRPLSTTRHMREDGLGGERIDTDQAGGSIVTTQTYDLNGRLTSQTDDNGNTTGYDYDALNRLTKTTFADDTAFTRIYDKRDLLKEWTDANGRHLVNTYDANGRLTARAFASAPSTPIESYDYDGLGRMTAASDNDSSMARAYDSVGRVIVETLNGKTTTATYDGVGNLKTCTYPGGREIERDYDGLNRLWKVRDAGSSTNLAEYRYTGPRRVERRDYPINGLRTVPTYDTVQRVTAIDHRVISSSVHVDQRSFAWDRASNKTQRANVSTGLAHDYTYNSVYQMVQSVRSGASTTTKTHEYGLDGVGNRTQVKTDGGTPASYSMAGTGDAEMNQYTSTPADGYTATPADSRSYDDEGNLTHVTVASTHDVTISYDYRNLMTEYDDSVTGKRHVYTYDALGRRTSKTVDADGSSPQVTVYYYLGSRIIEERNGADAVVATYVHGNGLDEMLSMRRGSDDYFYHADDLGSVMKVTDDTGTVVAQYEYRDFGQLLDGSSLNPVATSTIGDPVSFAGARLDLETGWYFLRTRYFDSQRGRFTTRDSIGAWGDAGNFGNASAYVSNNPWTYLDSVGTRKERKYTDYKSYKLYRANKRWERLVFDKMKGNVGPAGTRAPRVATLQPPGALRPTPKLIGLRVGPVPAQSGPVQPSTGEYPCEPDPPPSVPPSDLPFESSSPHDNTTPVDLGLEYFGGIGPRHHNFRDGDPFTELLKTHDHITLVRAHVIDSFMNGGSLEEDKGYSLAGWQGVPKYAKDYSSLLTFGLTGNLATTYLGSFDLHYTVTRIDTASMTIDVSFVVNNESNVESLTHPPVIGYTEWWHDYIGGPMNTLIKHGPLSPTTQTIRWTEKLGIPFPLQ